MKKKTIAVTLAALMLLGTGLTANAEEVATPLANGQQQETSHWVTITTSVKDGDYVPMGTDPLSLVTSVTCDDGCELHGNVEVEASGGDLNHVGDVELLFDYFAMDNGVEHNGWTKVFLHVEDPSNPTLRPLEGVNLDKAELTVKQGDEFAITLSTQPAENVFIQDNVSWRTDTQGVIKRFGPGEGGDLGEFGEEARFKAISPGTTTVTATLQGFTATCKVTVVAPETAPPEVPEKPVPEKPTPDKPHKAEGETLLVRRGNTYYFKNSLSDGPADLTIRYGRAGDEVLIGDWDGDGLDTLCVRRGNTYYFKNSLADGEADYTIPYGRRDDSVLVGDWDGDGKDTLCVRRGNTYYIKNSLSDGEADHTIPYGRRDDSVLVGDWDGDGKDTLCVRRGNAYYIKNSLGSGEADSVIRYGRANDVTYVGTWAK